MAFVTIPGSDAIIPPNAPGSENPMAAYLPINRFFSSSCFCLSAPNALSYLALNCVFSSAKVCLSSGKSPTVGGVCLRTSLYCSKIALGVIGGAVTSGVAVIAGVATGVAVGIPLITCPPFLRAGPSVLSTSDTCVRCSGVNEGNPAEMFPRDRDIADNV